MQEEPPPADLLICKEVLQHLPNAGVHRALSLPRPLPPRAPRQRPLSVRTANPAGSNGLARSVRRQNLEMRAGERSPRYTSTGAALQPERPAGAHVLEP